MQNIVVNIIPEQLFQRFAGSLPRYTSYPTAVELKQAQDDQLARVALQTCQTKPVSLYVHLPYCKSLCYFCACNKIISEDSADKDSYLDYLERECALIQKINKEKLLIADLHLGGGSPSYLNISQLKRLHQILRDHFDLRQARELSIEIDPRTFDREKAALLKSLGFSRASLGVQDFDAVVQEAVNRIQPLVMTQESCRFLKEAGFTGVNFDLIYGLPEQTLAGFRSTLEEVLKLRPDRIALYGYAQVPWKKKVQNVFNKLHLPTPEERLEIFQMAVAMLSGAGYEYIGLDHFALPEDELSLALRSGKLRRNFMGYTTFAGSGILALGVSAISDLGGTLYQNAPELEKYQAQIAAGRLPVAKILVRTAEDLVRATLIERVMCDVVLDLDQLGLTPAAAARAAEILHEAQSNLLEFEEAGLLRLQPTGFTVTELGRFFLRNIAAVFDAYLPLHAAGGKRVFSQAV